jgi:hypothetical protein
VLGGATIRALVLAVAGGVSLAAPADAAYPGTNGKIVFDTTASGPQIWTMNPDGSDITLVGSGGQPTWSPDGRKIAFQDTDCENPCNANVYVMNPDGSGRTRLTPELSGDGEPTWSPDGKKIAFISNLNGGADIWTMNADGTGRAKVTNDIFSEFNPAWSPDGKQIAFGSTDSGRLSVINVDRTGRHLLTPASGGYTDGPTWSPDGTQIMYHHEVPGDEVLEVVNPDGTGFAPVPNSSGAFFPAWSPDRTKVTFGQNSVKVMNIDGTNRVEVTSGGHPDWQPTVTGHIRPRSASPLRVPLVPAYSSCSSPNRTHGPPLAFDSCSPPDQVSPNLTVGTPDANGAAARSVGLVRLTVPAFSPGPPDDGEVLVHVSVTDVRCGPGVVTCGTVNASGGDDYTGELELELDVRLSDRFNDVSSPFGGADPATVTDFPLEFPMTCTATASTADGSSCELNTTFDTRYPGSPREGKRSVWELAQTKVFDGGPDGEVDTADNSLFEVQGVFVP